MLVCARAHVDQQVGGRTLDVSNAHTFVWVCINEFSTTPFVDIEKIIFSGRILEIFNTTLSQIF